MAKFKFDPEVAAILYFSPGPFEVGGFAGRPDIRSQVVGSAPGGEEWYIRAADSPNNVGSLGSERASKALLKLHEFYSEWTGLNSARPAGFRLCREIEEFYEVYFGEFPK